MPRDVAGNYTLPAGNPVVTNTLIASVWANTTLSDVASAMTNSLDRTGVSAGMTGQFKAFAGTGGSPGISFGLDTTSGIYRAGAGDYRFSVTTTDVMKWTAAGVTILVPVIISGAQLEVPDGLVGAPGLAFANEPSSGLYRIGAGDIAISVLGVKYFEINPAVGNQITFFNSAIASVAVLLSQNTSTTATQDSRIQVAAGSTNFFMYAANQNRATAVMTGGPAVPQVCLYTGQTVPIVFGTSNIARFQIPQDGISYTLGDVGSLGVAGLVALTLNNASTTAGQDVRIVVSAGATQGQLYAANVNGVTNITNGAAGATLTLKAFGNYPLQLGANNRLIMSMTGVSGSESIKGWGANAALLIEMSPDSGSFSGSAAGLTTFPSATIQWCRMGQLVLASLLATVSGTSNATTFGLTGLPASITPASAITQTIPIGGTPFTNAGVVTAGAVVMSNSSTISFAIMVAPNYQTSGWTNSGTKAVAPISWSYFIK